MGCVTLGFAQPTFTEKTFNDMMQGFQTGNEDFLKTQVTPDFLLVGTGGSVFTLPELIAFTKGSTTLTSDFSKVKIRQYDKTALVTGIWAHSHRLKNNNVVAHKELFTYTFIEQKGKWLMASAQHSEGPKILAEEEEAAIKAVIEKETQSWIDKDAEKRITCYANVPQAHSLIYHGRMNVNNGIAYSLNDKTDMPERIKATAASAPAVLGFKNDKYLIRINGSSAMVHFNQVLAHTSGEQQNMYNERYLEKINGEWKIVYIGGVSYKP